MEHNPRRNQPPAPGAPAASSQPSVGRWTPARQRIFLGALLETGSVTHAARAAGMSRSSAHGLRKRLAGTRFDQLWTRALRAHAGRLADPFGPSPAAPLSPSGRSPVARETRS